MVDYKHNEPYYKLKFSELEEDAVHVYGFEGHESISRLFEYRIELLSQDPEIDATQILNKKASLIFTRGEEDPIKINGIISHFEQRGKSPDYVSYYAVLVPKMWRLGLNFNSKIFQQVDLEAVVTEVLQESGFASEDFEFQLNNAYPQFEYCVQYRESDFDFVNRRLEHFGVYYYFDHRDENDVIVFTDSIDNLPVISQEDDIVYNPNKDPMPKLETVTELSCKEKVVTGKFKVKDYNFEYPDKDLQAEEQIDSEAPGTFYDYGDHFKDEGEGSFLAKMRNEQAVAESKLFHGKSDCRLFRTGFKFTFDVGEDYRNDWSGEYILLKKAARGNQHNLFAYLPSARTDVPTYENIFVAMPTDREYRPPRITPIPRISGILTAKVESGAGDEYAFLDDQGRYKYKVPFDLSGDTDGEASRPVRLSQPYSGPDYGVHFPNHAGTELVLSFVDGHVDRPLALGTVPNPNNVSPSLGGNKPQAVIRTAAQNELHFDDTTGSENIYLHGTKDWTIDIVNDKMQTIGHDETASVGNDRTRDVGNNETITIGNNRDKSVGNNQTEAIGANKSIQVGANHDESIGSSMSITVAQTLTETVGINYAETVGAAMELTVGGMLTQSVGAAKTESVGGSSSESVGKSKSVTVGKSLSETVSDNISRNAGKNFKLEIGENGDFLIGKKTKFQSGDDLTISSGKKAVIDVKDQLTIKCGKASIIMKKNGDIQIKGNKINIKASGDIKMKGSKIAQN